MHNKLYDFINDNQIRIITKDVDGIIITYFKDYVTEETSDLYLTLVINNENYGLRFPLLSNDEETIDIGSIFLAKQAILTIEYQKNRQKITSMSGVSKKIIERYIKNDK
jgi:hypothetical protein